MLGLGWCGTVSRFSGTVPEVRLGWVIHFYSLGPCREVKSGICYWCLLVLWRMSSRYLYQDGPNKMLLRLLWTYHWVCRTRECKPASSLQVAYQRRCLWGTRIFLIYDSGMSSRLNWSRVLSSLFSQKGMSWGIYSQRKQRCTDVQWSFLLVIVVLFFLLLLSRKIRIQWCPMHRYLLSCSSLGVCFLFLNS